MARGNTGKVSAVLVKALEEELKEITRKHGAEDTDDKGVSLKGKFVYSSTERMKIIDRFLKLESLKLKTDDAGFGSNFGKQGGDDEK